MSTATRHGLKAHRALLTRAAFGEALRDSFRKLSPRAAIRSPVIFVVLLGTGITAWMTVQAAATGSDWAFPAVVTADPARDRAVRELRRGRGRGARPRPGLVAAQHPRRTDGAQASMARARRACRPPNCAWTTW